MANSDINDIVQVDVSLDGAGVSRAGFGTALLCGKHYVTTNRIDFYSDAPAMLTAGFRSTDPLYKAASAYFQQKPTPNLVAIGNSIFSGVTIFVDTVTAGATYTVTFNGVDYAYTTVYASKAEILNGLQALLNVVTGFSAIVFNNEVLFVYPDSIATNPFFTCIVDSKMAISSFIRRVNIDSAVTKLYEIDIDEDTYSYNAVVPGDTVNTIAVGLVADINSSLSTKYMAIAQAPPSGLVLIIGYEGVSSFEVELDDAEANMTLASFEESYTTMALKYVQGSDQWYGIMSVWRIEDLVLDWSAYFEVDDAHLFGYGDSDSDIINTTVAADTKSLPAQLKVGQIDNTFGIYHSLADGDTTDQFIEAALFGARLTFDLDNGMHPNWMFAQLQGITTDVLTTTQRINANGTKESPKTGKNCNIYVTEHGLTIIKRGQVASGEWIDIRVGIHWFVARLQEESLTAFTSVNNPKIPFDDDGIPIQVNVLRNRLLKSFQVKFLTKDLDEYPNFGYNLTFKKRSEYTSAERALRYQSDIKCSALFAGAINAVKFNISFTA